MTLIGLPLPLRALRRLAFPHKLGICERLYGKAIARHGVCWVPTAAGVAWKLDLANPTHRWIVYGDYEGPGFLGWARAHLPRDGVVVDSGANIGQMALYLAQYVPEGRVLAVEPSAAAADWIEECVAASPGLPIEVLRLALGEMEGEARLKMQGPAEIHGAWNQVSESEGEPVSIARLDDVLSRKGIDRVDLWKLDVEGYEMHALRGAQELLRRRAVGALLVELAFGHGPAIIGYLEGFGYRYGIFDARGALQRPMDLPTHTNALFLPA